MRGFWRECRRVLGLPGLLLVPLCAGVLAGIDTHEGLPLDLLAVPITAAFVLVVVVLFTVLMCRIPRVRRRLDSRVAWPIYRTIALRPSALGSQRCRPMLSPPT